LEKVANKVIEIFKEISPKKATENLEGASEKVMKKAMTVYSNLYRKFNMK